MRRLLQDFWPVLGSLCLPVGLSAGLSVPLDLRPLFNNKGIGARPGEASFDGGHRAYPATAFAAAAPNGTWVAPLSGVAYKLPGYTGAGQQPDNVICGGQKLPLPDAPTSGSSAFSLSLLVASDKKQQIVSGSLVLGYSDGSRRAVELRAGPAWSTLTLSRGDLIAPYTWTATGIDGNSSHVFEYATTLAEPGTSNASLTSATLPDTRRSSARIHVFAATLWEPDDVSNGTAGTGNEKPPAADVKAQVQVQNVRPTQKWTDAGHQVVEVTLNNAGTSCFTSGRDAASISVEGDGVHTVEPGQLKRLCPGDQRRINVGVDSGEDTARDVNMTVVLSRAGVSNSNSNSTAISRTSYPFGRAVRLGFEAYTADPASLARHESPDWFDGAKYGIFIHWGPYAVPGYGGPPNQETYAEWFWWYSTHHADGRDPSDTYGYRERTFGRNWAYDDGFAKFTAENWDPREWVDLFAEAGATYFVITSKHHDGFALFDTGATTDRNALKYGPKRDVIKELMDAARQHQPHLKRGTYFSMPEWFNPDFAPYGFSSWPGRLAHNPFTGAEEPYTGRKVPGNGSSFDYVRDLQLPQMRTLAYDYEVDIMWCDCGPTTNATAAFMAEWWNGGPQVGGSLQAVDGQTALDREGGQGGQGASAAPRATRRQTTANSRCGLPQAADFETPEYATYSSAQRRKWESNRGMDPFSYGYNRATPDADYMQPGDVVYSLVDIVAKNGNFLLDIGPKADGSVVAAEAAGLRAAGAWIKRHGEALFNTTYWFVQTEWKAGSSGGSGADVRFTQTGDAFYVLFLKQAPRPGADGHVVVDAPVPALEGDVVSLLGVPGGENLRWKTTASGGLAVQASAALLAQDQYAWVFKVAYGG